MIVHLGRKVSNVDARQAAHENRIVVCLQKRGPMRENDVKLYTGAVKRVGHQVHNAAVENLVSLGIVQRLTTTRANSFILELAPDQSSEGKQQAGPGVQFRTALSENGQLRELKFLPKNQVTVAKSET